MECDCGKEMYIEKIEPDFVECADSTILFKCLCGHEEEIHEFTTQQRKGISIFDILKEQFNTLVDEKNTMSKCIQCKERFFNTDDEKLFCSVECEKEYEEEESEREPFSFATIPGWNEEVV